MNILLLCTDAFGGHGGIALFNRDLTEALAQLPERGEIVVLPRLIRNVVEPVPHGVTFVEAAARGQLAYARELNRARRGTKFDLVICSHVNLLPIAQLIATKDPLLITYGIEAWKPLPPLGERGSSIMPRRRLDQRHHPRQPSSSWSEYAGRTFVLPNAVRLDRYGIRRRSGATSSRDTDSTETRPAHPRADRPGGALQRIRRGARRSCPTCADDSSTSSPAAETTCRALKEMRRARRRRSASVFTGIFAEEEKADLYSLADVYAMPSRGEGFGFVLLEAMASGVPVIASSHDGGREAIRDGQLGPLVDPSNPAEIRTAIRTRSSRAERNPGRARILRLRALHRPRPRAS